MHLRLRAKAIGKLKTLSGFQSIRNDDSFMSDEIVAGHLEVIDTDESDQLIEI